MRASSLVPWEEEEGGDVDGGGRPLSKVPDVWRGSCWAEVRACLFCRCGGSAFPGLSQPPRLPAPQLLVLVRLQSQQARPCLSHVVPVVLALLPCLLSSKGPGAHSGAPGPPRLALGFKGLLTCSFDSPPRPDPHNLTSSHILGIGLETFRGDEVRGILLPTANLKKKKKAQGERCEFSFVWGPNEACSPGDSVSDGSEKLLQRGGAPVGRGGEVRVRVIVVKGEVCSGPRVFADFW